MFLNSSQTNVWLALLVSTAAIGLCFAQLNTECNVGPDALTVGEFVAPQTCIDVVEGRQERCWYTTYPSSSVDPVPLVLDLHGFDVCAQVQAGMSGWFDRTAEAEFVLAWPQGTTDATVSTEPCWDVGGCCCYLGSDIIGDSVMVPDVEFLLQVIADTVAASPVPIDTTRIYLAGHSNGCMMSQTMAAKMSGVIAGVCCHAGVLAKGVEVASDYDPTSIMIVHGDADDAVVYGGGVTDGINFTSAEDNLAYWGAVNGCTDLTVTTDESNLTATHVYSGCERDTSVQLLQVFGVGHFPYPETVFEIGNDWTEVPTTTLAQEFCFQQVNGRDALDLLPPATGSMVGDPPVAPPVDPPVEPTTEPPVDSPTDPPTSSAAGLSLSYFGLAFIVAVLFLATTTTI